MQMPTHRVLIMFFLALTLGVFAQAGPLVRLQHVTFDPAQTQSESFRQEVPADQNLWVMSFSTPITEKIKNEVRSHGYEILSFIPDQSLLIRGLRKDVTIRNLQAWTPYQAAWKWALDVPAPSVLNNKAARILLVRTYNLLDAKKLFAKLDRFQKVFVLHQTSEYFVIRGYDADLYRISEMPEVAHLQNLPEFQPHYIDLGGADVISMGLQKTGYETGTKVMDFETAWNAGFKGRGQIVAMGDTGLDLGDTQNIHPDFAGVVIKGQNFAPFGKSWEDSMGHGTHVAGSVVSRGTQSGGDFKGGAYEAQFIAHSLWSSMMNNLMIPTRLADMFAAGLEGGAYVHTNSWGSARSFGVYDSFARQVDDYMFKNPDLLVMFAAGNSGVDKDKDGRIDGDSIGSPGTAKNVLTVGASENYELQGGIQRKVSELRNAKDIWGAEPIYSSKISDNAQGLAMFSSRGPTDDGRIKPDVVAPGTNILSTRSRHKDSQDLWGRFNDDYVWSGGTSMSTPLVAGAAAVAREVLQKAHNIQQPSSSLLKAFLMNTAVDLFPGQYGLVGASQGQELLNVRPNSDEGFGLVTMKTIMQSENVVALLDNKQGLATGEEAGHEFTLAGEGTLIVTLVWNDAPASESAARALVNNLDLQIQGPDLNFNSQDAINNFEHFEKTAKAGSYKVKVLGRQIPSGIQGRQPYSLVIRHQSR